MIVCSRYVNKNIIVLGYSVRVVYNFVILPPRNNFNNMMDLVIESVLCY
jgi:hypothetical protein